MNTSFVLNIDYFPIDGLTVYAANSRTHSDEQVAQIAASIKEFGWTNPVLIDEVGGIVAGHGRVLAAKVLGIADVPCITLRGLTDAQRRAYVIADNKLALNAGWDAALLSSELFALQADGFDLSLIGFDAGELAELMPAPSPPGQTDEDAIPEPPADPVTRLGDVWQLGRHRVCCGDSTDVGTIALLMNGRKADLVHADPPYGMGKENEGVANDNLTGAQLDAFQIAWWEASKAAASERSSVYVWGWEHNLCLFYVSILLPLIAQRKATHKNWLVWDKVHGQGMTQDGLRRYPPVTEHCLFFAYGIEEYSTNADNYWDGWEPVRLRLATAVEAQGWKAKDLNRITGSQMGSHWVTKSQWTFITHANYEKLVAAAPQPAAFPAYGELREEYERAKRGDEANRDGFYSRRSFFDNTHDGMTDVWHFPRVTGDDRHDHATPKPVAMMERVMLSSLPEGGLCFEPFGGSGSTLMGAEKTGRTCYTMELQPRYCDTIVKRWQDFTGQTATLEATGEAFP